MQTALHALIQSAPVCKPIKADLRASTTTFEWPDNVLVQRTPYVFLPLAEVHKACAQEASLVAFDPPADKAYVRNICDDLDFEVERGNTRWSLYFYRIPGDKYPKPPCSWSGNEIRIDTEGRTWRRSLDYMVMDDFGTLVSSDTGGNP